MNLAEQIRAFEEKRAALVAANEGLISKAAEEGATLDQEQSEQFDENEADITEIDKHLDRLRKMEKASLAKAVPADGSNAGNASAARGGSRIEVKREEKLAPGIGFARIAKCVALAGGSIMGASEVAKARYGENSNVFGVLKAAVAAGSTASGNWAEDLVGDETSAFADFVEYLRPQTILGKFGTNGIPSLRRIPFRTPLVGQTAGGSGYWVGEGNAKPVTAFDFSRTTLEPLKVANIAVLTEEVIRDSSPSAEAIVRDALADALRERLDIDFIDPTKTAATGVSPASITNGATTIAASGTGDADAVRLDVRSLMATFIAANNAPTSGVWIMSTGNALALSVMVNALGQAEFNSIGMNGGTFFGLPVITSEYVEDNVVLANASDIYFADEGGITVDLSREASLQMDSAPDNPSTDSTVLVSLWQRNLVGIRAERALNWALRRPSGVAVLTGAAWGGAVNVS